MTPAERRLRGQAGAYALWAKHDPRELSKAGRDAAWERFIQLVDPERILPEAERQRRAEAARRSHLSSIALKSVQARAQKAGRRADSEGRSGSVRRPEPAESKEGIRSATRSTG
jgi:hypothetical protein